MRLHDEVNILLIVFIIDFTIWSHNILPQFLWLLACDLHRSCDDFVEESYLMGVKYNGYKDMSKLLHDAFGCKTCMIINAEVTVVSIEVIALFVAKFTIRSSRHGLKRIQMYCNQEAVCPFLQRLRALSPGSMIDNTPPQRESMSSQIYWSNCPRHRLPPNIVELQSCWNTSPCMMPHLQIKN